MPTPITAAFPPPQDDDEFENIVRDALALRLRTPHLVRFGRSGQTQGGIDGFTPQAIEGDNAIVWQATITKPGEGLWTKLQRDLASLDSELPWTPTQFWYCVSAPRDAELQYRVAELSSQRQLSALCTVEILFWDDIRSDICNDVAVMNKYFSSFFTIPEESTRHVQRGRVSFGPGDHEVTDTITSVPLNQSSLSFSPTDGIVGEIATSTQLRFQREPSSKTCWISWEVVTTTGGLPAKTRI